MSTADYCMVPSESRTDSLFAPPTLYRGAEKRSVQAPTPESTHVAFPLVHVENKASPKKAQLMVQNPRKRKKLKKSGKRHNSRPLKNVSAADISLQDAANYVGAVWKYGSMALGALASINAEEKRYYSLFHDGAMGATKFVQYITGIAQGTDYNQRTGNSIKVRSIRMEYLLSANATAGRNVTRVILLRDLMNQGAGITETDVLQDTSSQTSWLVSPYKVNNADRFEVYYDEVITNVYAGENSIVHKRLAFGVDDHVLYTGTGTTTASAWQGCFFLIVLTNEFTNVPALTLTYEIDYVDD